MSNSLCDFFNAFLRSAIIFGNTYLILYFLFGRCEIKEFANNL